MAGPVPSLDDRRYAELVEDSLRLARRSCPDWTDEGPADIGVALVEACAWVTERLLRRLDAVPELLRTEFLDLIGLRMFPPTPATTGLTFWLTTPADTAVVVPAGTTVATRRAGSEPAVVFSTRADLSIAPCSLQSVRTRAAGAQELGQHNLTDVDFPAFGGPPATDDELLLGLDTAAPGMAVRVEYAGRTEGLGIDPDDPPLVWEAWTGDGWVECEVDDDGTGGLNRTGSLVLHLPGRHVTSLVDGVVAGWVRARVVAGEDGQAGYSASPQVTSLAAAVVGGTTEAVQAEYVDEELGRTTGVPGQVFTVQSGPLLSAGAGPTVQISSEDGWQEWTLVDEFSGSGPRDRHVRLDPVPGRLSFGPAVRLPDGGLRQYGAVPTAGEQVRLLNCGIGGGRRGNVNPGMVSVLRSSVPFVAAVGNRQAAHGGTDGETPDQARDRAPITLRTLGRAVTAEDYEALAREAVPQAARIHCVPAGPDAPAAVRVLVVPSAAQHDGVIALPDLVPSTDLLHRLAERLDEVRLVGSRVLVEPPRYRGVTVVARLVARPRVDRDRVRSDALTALYRYLSPLSGGGVHGTGWDFGRAVRSGEVYAVLQAVGGVETVEDVRLFGANPVTGERGAEQQRIELEPNSLVFSYEHLVRVEDH